MQITIIGAGYVGLVTGVCMAEYGHQVTLVENDLAKLKQLKKGKPTIYEAGLAPLLKKHVGKDIFFVSSLREVSSLGSVVFLALPTPPQMDGAPNLDYVLQVLPQVAAILPETYTVIANKSTVPLGTTDKVYALLEAQTDRPFDVVSTPEFLREGTAVADCLQPDRIVIGARNRRAQRVMEEIYAPFKRPVVATTPASAELAKYAANAFLAMRISFINEIANIAEHAHADISQVRQVIGMDPRIGERYLEAGIGYGGSCLPKDVAALCHSAQTYGYDPVLLQAVKEVNTTQSLLLWNHAQAHFKAGLEGLHFGVWGLAFKSDTDDIRESPALANIRLLHAVGAHVRVHDPKAMPAAKRFFESQGITNITYAATPQQAAQKADALFVFTPWDVYAEQDVKQLKGWLKQPVVFDGRNVFDAGALREAGFTYTQVGTPSLGIGGA